MWEYSGNLEIGPGFPEAPGFRGRAPGPGRRDIIGQFSDTGQPRSRCRSGVDCGHRVPATTPRVAGRDWLAESSSKNNGPPRAWTLVCRRIC
jgi:hypothetical protein